MKETAYKALKNKILTNVFSAGEFIDDSAEAAILNMSKTPVREALLLLEAEGLVEVMPRRGIRVVPISIRDMEEIYQLLTALEVAAVGLLSKRDLTAELLAPLSDACQIMRTELESGDTIAWNKADETFHRGLLTLSGNRHLAETGIRYRERVQRAHLIAMRLSRKEYLALSVKSHQDLVDCLLSDDPQQADILHQQQRLRGGVSAVTVLRDSGLNQF